MGRRHDDDRIESDSTERDGASTDTPRSERETQELQRSPLGDSAALDDVDERKVEVLPGTGGQDDEGDVDVEEGDVDIPRMSGARDD